MSGALLNVFMIAVVEAIALLTGKGSRDARRKLFKGASVIFRCGVPPNYASVLTPRSVRFGRLWQERGGYPMGCSHGQYEDAAAPACFFQ